MDFLTDYPIGLRIRAGTSDILTIYKVVGENGVGHQLYNAIYSRLNPNGTPLMTAMRWTLEEIEKLVIKEDRLKVLYKDIDLSECELFE
jgi:hypothetical protein